MNILIATGNLGQDCEVRYPASGTAVCSFSIAMTHGYGDKKGTVWVRCALFGKRADGKLPEYLVKGASVCVSGEISLNEWQNNEGVTKTSLQLNVDKLDLIGGRPEAAPQPMRNQAPQQPAQQQAPQTQGNSGFDDDGVPF